MHLRPLLHGNAHRHAHHAVPPRETPHFPFTSKHLSVHVLYAYLSIHCVHGEIIGLEKTSHMSAEDISLCAFSLSYGIFALFFMGTLADTRIMQYRAEKELILLRKHYGLPCNATPDIEACVVLSYVLVRVFISLIYCRSCQLWYWTSKSKYMRLVLRERCFEM